MSCQKGNVNRTRAQKYKNQTTFINNLHDKSHTIKSINNTDVTNVCEHCKKIIEWKIKYKKYKRPKAAAKCIKCEEKSIKHAYHNICLVCAKQQEICPKCGEKREIVKATLNREEQIKLDVEIQKSLKTLSERKRRTFLRYINQEINDKTGSSKDDSKLNTNKINEKDVSKYITSLKNKEDILMKLSSLSIKNDIKEDDNFDNDTDDDLDEFI